MTHVEFAHPTLSRCGNNVESMWILVRVMLVN